MSKKLKLSKEVSEAIIGHVKDAFVTAYQAMAKEVRGQYNVSVNGYGDCGIEVWDNLGDGDPVIVKLSEAVDFFLAGRYGSDEDDAWLCDEVATDLERQAKRIRDHVKKTTK